MDERLGRDDKNLSPLSNPLYTGVLRDFLRDERFFDKTFLKTRLWFAKICNYSCKFVPRLGTVYSQLGNISFPGWEHFVPNVGIIQSFNE